MHLFGPTSNSIQIHEEGIVVEIPRMIKNKKDEKDIFSIEFQVQIVPTSTFSIVLLPNTSPFLQQFNIWTKFKKVQQLIWKIKSQKYSNSL